MMSEWWSWILASGAPPVACFQFTLVVGAGAKSFKIATDNMNQPMVLHNRSQVADVLVV
jgi:hypothetical protein